MGLHSFGGSFAFYCPRSCVSVAILLNDCHLDYSVCLPPNRTITGTTCVHLSEWCCSLEILRGFDTKFRERMHNHSTLNVIFRM